MARADGRRRPADGRAPLKSETIVALSSGSPPAAIAIVRVSGPDALTAAAALAGPLPPPRHAAVRALRDEAGELLDRAVTLVFPGPGSATGEDVVELHLHGGAATVAATIAALLARPNVRRAEPGEFTRRGVLNGRLDLAQAQGLADLLVAETEQQRRMAIRAAEGEVSRTIRGWMERLTALAAELEASIDFDDEADVDQYGRSIGQLMAQRATLLEDMRRVLDAPPVERLLQGWHVVIAGPPNAGKSTLINLLAERDVAIVSPMAGTTRDNVGIALRRRALAYRLTDTAGLRDDANDPVERAGIDRSHRAIADADLIVWLGEEPIPGNNVINVHARADRPGREMTPDGFDLAVSHDRPDRIDQLWTVIERRAGTVTASDIVSLHREERAACEEAAAFLAISTDDVILLAETLRASRVALARILGEGATELLLTRLFSRFCIGK